MYILPKGNTSKGFCNTLTMKGEFFMHETNKHKGNVLVIHGGGLVEPSKLVLMRISQNLSTLTHFDTVYIGQFSFESLYSRKYIKKYNMDLVNEVKDKRGTYFGTSRGIDLATNSLLFKKSVDCLSSMNIRTLIVAGGDGSSRQVTEIHELFKEYGINVIFPIPLTIDGINGGLSIGLNEAVRESVRQIENISSTSLQTRDQEKFGVVIVELHGRNRDDILANVLKHFVNKKQVADFNLNDLTLAVVPATIKTDPEKLFDKVNNSSKRTLILISEGAELSIPELKKGINRKVRSLVVGHPSQSNNMTTSSDIIFYNDWIDNACKIIADDPFKSYCVVNNGITLCKRSISYYADLNPRNGQKVQLPEDSDLLIRSFMS